MIRIDPITRVNADAFLQVRLCALLDAPSAFGSTYAREAAFGDHEWARRVERWSGEQGIGFLGMDGDKPCGIAGALLEDAGQAQLVSMWTAPEYRERGVGRLLVEAVAGWAARRGVHTLRLMVTSKNEPALRFYGRLAFTRTGRVEPYPNDPALVEWEMARRLD
jgi:ribosomal protein S18 acetylase RimI-like enzyme